MYCLPTAVLSIFSAYASIFSNKICTRKQIFFAIIGMIKCTNVLTSILCSSNYGGIETDLQTEWYVVSPTDIQLFCCLQLRKHPPTKDTHVHQCNKYTPTHTNSLSHTNTLTSTGYSWWILRKSSTFSKQMRNSTPEEKILQPGVHIRG